MSRTKKTAINSGVGMLCSIISSFLSFLLRALFIRLLGLEYAGINSLFADILKILNLADLGFNNAILFRLYKTIADKDDDATEAYLALYRRICYAVGAIIGIVGLCFIPFLDFFIKETPSFKEPLWSIYIIVLATSVINHLVNYKNILLIAKQDRYISTLIQYACIFLKHALQIVALVLFKNIYVYLFVTLICTLIRGGWTGAVSRKRYHLSWRSKKEIPTGESRIIAKDIVALSVYKLCRTLDATIDTFLISKYVAVSTTAIYGSFVMLLDALNELLGSFNDGMIASIGDLNTEGNKDRLYSVFLQSFHFTFLIYGTCTATLVPFISAFCKWWINNTLDSVCVYVLLLNFLMYGFGMNVAAFRNPMGIFRKGWIRPGITAVLNFSFSVILVNKIGLVGTLFGTLLARIFTLVWFEPWLVLHHGMGKSPVIYYVRYVLYLVLTGAVAVTMLLLKSILPEMNSFLSLLWHGGVFFAASSIMILALGFVIPEQKLVLNRAFRIFYRMKR